MPASPSNPAALTYRCAPDIRWVVQTAGLTLIREGRGAIAELHYPEAAVWDLIDSWSRASADDTAKAALRERMRAERA